MHQEFKSISSETNVSDHLWLTLWIKGLLLWIMCQNIYLTQFFATPKDKWVWQLNIYIQLNVQI